MPMSFVAVLFCFAFWNIDMFSQTSFIYILSMAAFLLQWKELSSCGRNPTVKSRLSFENGLNQSIDISL